MSKDLTRVNREAKELAIKERIKQIAARSGTKQIVKIANGSKPIKASFSQERLWYLHQISPEDTSYNTYFGFEVDGHLKADKFEQALALIIDRHESLRTTFTEINGEAFQRINDLSDSYISLVDFTNEPYNEKVNNYIKSIIEQPFSLEKGPLFKAYLIKLSDMKWILFFHMHHIIFDGWSVGIFMGELQEIYSAYIDEREAEVLDVSIQYADFSIWQRNHLTEDRLSQYIKYWEKKLQGAPQFTELPYDRKHPKTLSSNGDLYKFQIPSNIAEKVKILSRDEGTTLYITLLSAFYVLLNHYTRQKDIVVGSPTAARTNKDIEAIIGFFVNMICLRTTIEPHSSFKSLIQRVTETCIEAYSNQDLPFERLIEALNPERDLSRSPIFQVMFELQHGSHTVILPNVTVSSIEDVAITAKYELSVIIEEVEDGSLIVNFEYATDLFNRETIVRMGNNYKHIIESIMNNPHCNISEIDILTSAERRILLSEWNNTHKDFKTSKNFFNLFKQQAVNTPDSIAVIDDEGSLSYQELFTLSQRIAVLLLKKGADKEDVIGLLGKRDRNYLASILGIMQIGAVYLPLDPNYPGQRLKHILDKSKCEIVLLTSQDKEITNSLYTDSNLINEIKLLNINEADSINSIVDFEVKNKNLAYIIFTSGSTGLPKGSMIEHENMVNHLLSKIDDLKITDKDVLAQTASQCFDISIWQFLNMLIVGGKVRIYNDHLIRDPYMLLKKMIDDRITIAEFTPSYLKLIIEEFRKTGGKNNSIKAMLVTGEQADSTLLRSWLEICKGSQIINAYGPSECSDDVTLHKVEDKEQLLSNIAEIGKPISNTEIYILDDNLDLLPIGAKGEIYVGGAGVGRGYSNDPKITASKYLPNPFSSKHGERLFKTGDIGRYRIDGTLEFLGRFDNQVKIRGFRIELEEIESNMLKDAMIRDAVVVVHVDDKGSQHLIAYVTLNEPIKEIDIKSNLQKLLPNYMIPSQFIVLENLPLTPNGKVDRKNLPEPQKVISENFVPLTTEAEFIIADIWREVLGVKKLGKKDHFFDVGGHSLLGIQALARIKKVFDINIPVSCIFETPILEELAEYVETIKWFVTTNENPMKIQ